MPRAPRRRHRGRDRHRDRRHRTAAVVVVLLALAACDGDRSSRHDVVDDELDAAGGVVPDARSPNAYGHAVANLDRSHWIDLRDGKAIFVATWVAAGEAAAARAARGPAAEVREGLGPRFEATSCQSCHFRDGRGGPPRARGEAGLRAAASASGRSPPSLVGLGLLEAVPAAALEARADPDDADGDGISGRARWIRDARTGQRALGRFGWKASHPTLRHQNAAALHEHLGVTSPLHPAGACAAGDAACADAPIELADDDLERLTRYTRLLGPPARRHAGEPATVRGEALFAAAGCAACHVARLTTGAVVDLPELGGQRIAPYTDLLLHDLGDGLADHRPDGDTDGREWRTAPLWGLGRLADVSGDVRLLHDGRARSAEAAILWHGGEAQAARDAFAALPAVDRAALLRFLDSI